MEEIKVLFYSVKLSVPIEDVRASLVKDKTLNEVIIKYGESLKEEGEEVWLVEDNMIVTESGYKIAEYEQKEKAESN